MYDGTYDNGHVWDSVSCVVVNRWAYFLELGGDSTSTASGKEDA